METANKPARLVSRRLSSSSFRLHSPSLNSIRLRRIFDIFDKNGDGVISVAELNLALELLGLETEPTEIEYMVRSYIRPGNTGLAFDDFVSLHQSLDETFFGNNNDEDHDLLEHADDDNTSGGGGGSSSPQEEADLTEAFKVFDEDGDGFISAQELQEVLRKLGMPEGGDICRVEKMIFSVDRNLDGRVDFHEFKDMMHSVMVRS
ncbi:calcium-binding protein CML42-like [Macadamia integrifolia]|uniref:calcium-binding protein CML42-like n=1 Tax=Macadamia integrifolia TaxID=60698 RepID=UPI001C4F101F|nr:calcium-binding protein CML42-like [Macadamia integrifolia]